MFLKQKLIINSIPIAYPTFHVLPKEKRLIANTERYQTMGSFSPGKGVLNAHVLSQPGNGVIKPVAVSNQVTPENIQKAMWNECKMQLHDKMSHGGVKIIAPNAISVDALNSKHLSKEFFNAMRLNHLQNSFHNKIRFSLNKKQIQFHILREVN